MIADFWSYVPSFDGQTIVSLVVGSILAIWLYWLSVKRTIGAQQERVRATNAELISSVVKRIAVEREVMTLEQFATIRMAKAYRSQVEVGQLLSFTEAKAALLADVIDNNFLDQSAKNAIIEIVTKSNPPTATAEAVSQKVGNARERSIDDKFRVATFGLVAIVASFAFDAVSNWFRGRSFSATMLSPSELAVLFSIIAAGAIVALVAFLVIPSWVERSVAHDKAERDALTRDDDAPRSA